MVTAPILPTTFLVLLGTIGFAIHLFLTLTVYRIANDSGMNAKAWALLYFFTIPIGMVLFLVARTAGTTIGCSDCSSGDPDRKRMVDARRMDQVPRSQVELLPRLSRGFIDEHLRELFYAEEWERAAAHIQEMKELATEDGNKNLAEDYRRVMLWLYEKRNPFSVG